MTKVTVAGSEYDKVPFTPDDANALPTGKAYSGESAKDDTEITMVTLVRTADGFDAQRCDVNGGAVLQTYRCGPVDKEGGHGNATVKCETENGCIWRMEWINPHTIKFEWWMNMQEMAGQKQNKPGRDLFVLTG